MTQPVENSPIGLPPAMKYPLNDGSNKYTQGDQYGHGKGYVDIKFTVPFQHKLLVLKRNFKIAVNKNSSMTIRVTLYVPLAQIVTVNQMSQKIFKSGQINP